MFPGVTGMQANSLVQRVMKGALVLLVALEIGACWSTVVSGDRSPVYEMKCKSSNAGEAVPNQGAAWLFFLLKCFKKNGCSPSRGMNWMFLF